MFYSFNRLFKIMQTIKMSFLIIIKMFLNKYKEVFFKSYFHEF